jgi:hypothetical protein
MQYLPVERKGVYVKVDPYLSGYVREFVLAQSALTRPDVKDLSEVLTLLNNQVFCRTKDFTREPYKGDIVPITQRLKSLSESQFEILSFKRQSYFMGFEHWHKGVNHPEIRYRFRFPFLYELEISERYVTHHWIPDSAYEARYQELRYLLYMNYENSCRLYRMMDWHTERYDDRSVMMQYKKGCAKNDHLLYTENNHD